MCYSLSQTLLTVRAVHYIKPVIIWLIFCKLLGSMPCYEEALLFPNPKPKHAKGDEIPITISKQNPPFTCCKFMPVVRKGGDTARATEPPPPRINLACCSAAPGLIPPYSHYSCPANTSPLSAKWWRLLMTALCRLRRCSENERKALIFFNSPTAYYCKNCMFYSLSW